MRRWLLRFLFSAGFLAAAAVLAVWLVLRSSLPSIDGELKVAGLSSAATIKRDDHGIPTISASSRIDLAFATGFAHGQDRYFQMDLIRRRAAGELSAIIGSATLESDKAYRLHRFRSRARAVLTDLSAADRQLLEAYAAGANAGLESLDARPFEYWLLRSDPQPWLAEDSILVLYAMFAMLNDSTARRDVQKGLAHRVFSESVYRWLYPDGSPWDAPLVGAPRDAPAVPGPDELTLQDSAIDVIAVDERGNDPIPGSNNWAVSGALTSDGAALVANDMHLGIGVPNIYYQAQLVVTGDDTDDVSDDHSVDVAGVTIPGTPFVVAGSNRKVAWGYTNSYGDWTDAVLLMPGGEPDSYRTPAGDRRFDLHSERIAIKGEAGLEFEVRESIWGPVREAEATGQPIAVSWIAHHIEAVNLNLVRLESAASVDEALDIANTMGIPPQNFVVGDSRGNIAWTIAGRIPRRGAYDPGVPADWSEAEGWQGWLEPDAYPRIVNPPSGRIWTANSRVVDGAGLAVVGDGGYDRGARSRQIRDALFAKERFGPLDMLAIQTDDRALFLARWQQLLVRVLSQPAYRDEPGFAEYLEAVQDWTPRASAESVGYRLVRSFRLQVESLVWEAVTAPLREAYGPEVRSWRSPQFEAALWQLVTAQPEHLLPANYANWDALLADGVRVSIDYYAERYSTPLAERTWGERNTARIQHPLSLAVPALSRWLDMPREPLNGDADLPLAQSPTFGASERFAVSPANRGGGIMHMPTGQSGHPLSDFYRRGHDDWVGGRTSGFLPGSAAHELRLVPR